MTEHVSLRIGLLDKQLLDCHQLPFGRVDDVDIALPEGGEAPRVIALLTGAHALGERLGGRLGRWMAATAQRLRETPDAGPPAQIDARLISELEPSVALSVPFDQLKHVAGLERWLAHHIVEPLPRAGDASQ
ncbi:MAG: hypothetical protein M3295_00905 [Chloroflexota bacterium]|nr:hypothetical protein [Chloroflexota bacterium]